MKKKEGRPTKYDPKYCEALIKFFDIEPYFQREIVTTGKNDYTKTETVDVANDIPHLCHFAKKIGVNTDTLNQWSKVHPEFSDALKRAKELNEAMLMTNGLKGLYNSTFAIFSAKNKFGWRDEQHLTGEGFENKQIVQVYLPTLSKSLNGNHSLKAAPRAAGNIPSTNGS